MTHRPGSSRPPWRSAGAIGLAALLTACGGSHQAAAASDPNNPLIGRWRFVSIGADTTSGPSACTLDMTFAPGLWTQTQGGGTTNAAVTYIPSAKVVYVVGGDGSHVTYVLIDANHIALDSFAPCTYERVG